MRIRFWLPPLLVALAIAPARSYLREDHNYSVRLLLNSLEPPLDGEALVGLCAQLPDEAPEISAIDVYQRLMTHPLDYAQWVLRKTGPAATVGRMVTVQQLQHGLTGGSPEGVRRVAETVVHDIDGRLSALPKTATQQRANDLCALGLALHLYGDSFSHQRLKNPQRMYSAGIGHLFDSSMPDIPYYSKPRLQLWRQYLTTLPDLLPHQNHVDLHTMFDAMDASQCVACRQNGYNLMPLRTLFRSYLDRFPKARRLSPFNRRLKPRGCQAMVNWQAAQDGITPVPSCEDTWTIFRDAALTAYTDYDRAHPDQPSREPTKAPYFKDSPFSKGAAW